MTNDPRATPEMPRIEQPTRARRSPLVGLGLTALVAAGAVAGATAIFSSQAQTTTQDFARQMQTALNATGVAKVEQTGYQKGFTSSTQTMSLTLQSDQTSKPLKLLVTNHIQHGPFPGFQGVGQAVVDTDIRFEDAQIQAELDKAFAGKKPRIRTLIGLGGGTNTNIEVPNGRFAQDGETVTWQPLTGHINVNGNTTSTNMKWPSINLTGAQGNGEMTGMTLVGSSSRSNAEDRLGVGNGTLTIGQMKFSSDGQDMLLNGLKVSSESKPNGPDHLDALAKYDIAEVKFADQDLKNIQLHVGLNHLAKAPLNRIVKLISDLQQQSTKSAQTVAGQPQVPDLTDAQTQQLTNDAIELLKGNPELNIERLSITQPSGDIVISGKATMPKAASMSSEDLQMLSAMPQMLATMLDVQLKAEGKEKAVQELLALFGGSTGQAQANELAANLQGLTEAGLVKRTGDQLSMEFLLKDGTPTVNGQALGE